MFEQALHLNMIVEWRDKRGPALETFGEPTGFGLQDRSRMSLFTHPQSHAHQMVHREGPGVNTNCQFLWWYPGSVSHVGISGLDVLTGPMSGCLLVTFRLDGIVHAGHLGTDIDSVENTDNAWDAWQDWAGLNAHDVVGGFFPAKHWSEHLPMPRPGEAGAKIFGLMTAQGEFWSFLLYQQIRAGIFRVAGKWRHPSLPLHEVIRRPG